MRSSRDSKEKRWPARDDAKALFDAEFKLMSGELLRLLAGIVEALGGELAHTHDLIDQAKE